MRGSERALYHFDTKNDLNEDGSDQRGRNSSPSREGAREQRPLQSEHHEDNQEHACLRATRRRWPNNALASCAMKDKEIEELPRTPSRRV